MTTLVETAAYGIRSVKDRNPAALQYIEEQTIQHINNWLFGELDNDEAVKLMDEARAYNTKHYKIKYPKRPRDNVIIRPELKDHRLLVEKAADYLRQYHNKDSSSSLQHSEERIIDLIHGWTKDKMSNDEAVKLMDEARAYNTKHYKIKYPKRPRDNVIIRPDSKDHPMLIEKIADRMRQSYDKDKPEALPDIEEQIIIDLYKDIDRITNEEALRLMDGAREYNARHYGVKYPARPPGQVIIMPDMLAADCDKMTVQKAAYYLRQMCKGQSPSVPARIEAQIIERLQRWREKMTNETAIKIMDDAKAYNTKHHGIKYKARSAGAVLIKPHFKSYESMVREAAKRLREKINENAPFALQHHEEMIIKHMEEKTGRLTNEEAVKLMDKAREYNTKKYGTEYPARPQNNIIITPYTETHPLMIEKAADYIRQACDESGSEALPDREEEIIIGLEDLLWIKMTNEEAIKLLDDARAYNTEHYGTRYPPRPAGQVVVRTDLSSEEDGEIAVQKAAYYLRRLCDGKDPEHVEGEIIGRLKKYSWDEISNEEAVKIMDDARAYNTKHYGIKYPEPQARQIIMHD